MNQRKITFNLENITLYLVGFFLIGLGVNLMLRSNLGGGAWDAVTSNLHDLAQITLGTASFIVSSTVFTIILLYRRQVRFFFIVIPMMMVALSIDLWDLVLLGDLAPTNTIIEIVFYIIGSLILALGLSLTILSNFPAFVFDELMLLIMHFMKTEKLAVIRFGIEVFAIVLGIILGLLAGIGLGAVNIGSVIFAFTLGPIMNFYISRYKQVRRKTV